MEEDHFSVKRSNLETTFTNGLRVLYTERDLGDADVTLSAEEKIIQVHKWLLCLCSPYFKKLFRTNSIASKAGNTVVILANVKFRDLENLIYFMYNGEVKVKTNEEVQGVLEVGELLKIEGLPWKRTVGTKGTKESQGSTCQPDKSNMTISSSIPSEDKVSSTPITSESSPSVNQRSRNKRPGSHQVPYSPSNGSKRFVGPPGSKRFRHRAVKAVVIKPIIVNRSDESSTTSQGIQDNHGTERYNEHSGGLVVPPLAQLEVQEEEDPLGNIEVDPLAFEEEGLEEGSGTIEVKLEDVDYQNIGAKENDEGVFNATDEQEDSGCGTTTEPESSRIELSTVSKLASAEKGVSEGSGFPWFFRKFYSKHMDELTASFEDKECVRCGRVNIRGKPRLARHFVTHLPPNFPCRICGLKLSSDTAMTVHLKASHGVIGTGKNWGEELSGNEGINDMTLINKEQADDLRSECSRTSELSIGTKLGKPEMMPPGVPKYFPKYYRPYLPQLLKCFEDKSCVECGKQVEQKYPMARHFLTHVPPNFPCGICGVKLSHDCAVYKHTRAKHGHVGPNLWGK